MARKRSLSINLSRMRKQFRPKPLALGIAAVFISACSDNRQDAQVYVSPQECEEDNPGFAEQCETAYQQALIEAERTAPKYRSEYDCEYEFGANQCRYVERDSGSFFMPFMAGYMLSNLMSPRYHYSPLFTSYSRYSPYRNRWIGSDGHVFGDYNRKSFKVRSDTFKPKPTVSRTIKRGGFGSSVRAKSSWGKSGSRSWGG